MEFNKVNETRIETAYKFLSENYPNTQLFHSRNIVGDEMKTIFVDNGVMIDICYGYDYIEVFGLNDTEFSIVKDKLQQDRKIVLGILGIEEENYKDEWKLDSILNQFHELKKKYQPRQIWLKGDECYAQGEIIDSTDDLIVVTRRN